MGSGGEGSPPETGGEGDEGPLTTGGKGDKGPPMTVGDKASRMSGGGEGAATSMTTGGWIARVLSGSKPGSGRSPHSRDGFPLMGEVSLEVLMRDAKMLMWWVR